MSLATDGDTLQVTLEWQGPTTPGELPASLVFMP